MTGPLERFRDHHVDDLLGERKRLRLLIVGINPSLRSAATGTHFAHPSNRFYPALHAAGITERSIDARDGLSPRDRAHLLERGLGITNLVRRATARASELGRDELRAGARRLAHDLTRLRPAVVAVVGIGAYRVAFAQPRAAPGPQPGTLAGVRVWALPNPSGLNAHETVDSLAGWYRAAAQAAGIAVVDRPDGRPSTG